MRTIGFLRSEVSALALNAADGSHLLEGRFYTGFHFLEAAESLSILGCHNGILDDDLFDMLEGEFG